MRVNPRVATPDGPEGILHTATYAHITLKAVNQHDTGNTTQPTTPATTTMPDTATDSPTELYIACPECVSFYATDSPNDNTGTIKNHNERSHDDDTVARVLNARDTDDLREFLETVRERAPGNEYDQLIRRMHKGNAAFSCTAKTFREAVPKEDQRIY